MEVFFALGLMLLLFAVIGLVCGRFLIALILFILGIASLIYFESLFESLII